MCNRTGAGTPWQEALTSRNPKNHRQLRNFPRKPKLMRNLYFTPAIVVGGLSFCAIWLYALLEWGLLLGFLFGWMPAVIGGAFLGAIWPLTIVASLWLINMLSHH